VEIHADIRWPLDNEVVTRKFILTLRST